MERCNVPILIGQIPVYYAAYASARDSCVVYITCNLADAFIQSDLQLIRLGRRHTPWSNVGVKGLAQGANSCADFLYFLYHGRTWDRTTDLAGPSQVT